MTTSARNYYYRKVGPGSWLKSNHPHKTGVWVNEKEYHIQRQIEKQAARYTRRNIRRQLRSE